MSNLPDERRGELAAWFSENLTSTTFQLMSDEDFADALAPMLAGWLAEEREAGARSVRFDRERHFRLGGEAAAHSIAEAIEAGYLGPDFGRGFDGRESPDAALHHAYDEGLQHAAEVARNYRQEKADE